MPDWVIARGDVFDVRLDNAEGSEQQGLRPAIVVSRQGINETSPVISIVPLTTYRPHKKTYPSQTIIFAPEGGLTGDSVAKCEQVRPLSTERIIGKRGRVTGTTMKRIDDALRNALGLDP